jgi:hypothetical protein
VAGIAEEEEEEANSDNEANDDHEECVLDAFHIFLVSGLFFSLRLCLGLNGLCSFHNLNY